MDTTGIAEAEARSLRVRVAAILCEASYYQDPEEAQRFMHSAFNSLLDDLREDSQPQQASVTRSCPLNSRFREQQAAQPAVQLATIESMEFIHTRIIMLGNQSTVLATLKYKGDPYLFIAFRGTYDEKDLVCDLKVMASVQLDGKVHSGFWEVAEQIDNNFCIEFLAENHNAKVVVCGHSKGGGVAQLYTLRFIRSFLFSDAYLKRIFCVTFGSPLVGDKALSERVGSLFYDDAAVKRCFLNIVNNSDAVPCLLLLAKRMGDGFFDFFSSALALAAQQVFHSAVPAVTLCVTGHPSAILAIEALQSFFQNQALQNLVQSIAGELKDSAVPNYYPLSSLFCLMTDQPGAACEDQDIFEDCPEAVIAFICDPKRRISLQSYTDHHMVSYYQRIRNHFPCCISRSSFQASANFALDPEIQTCQWLDVERRKLIVRGPYLNFLNFSAFDRSQGQCIVPGMTILAIKPLVSRVEKLEATSILGNKTFLIPKIADIGNRSFEETTNDADHWQLLISSCFSAAFDKDSESGAAKAILLFERSVERLDPKRLSKFTTNEPKHQHDLKVVSSFLAAAFACGYSPSGDNFNLAYQKPYDFLHNSGEATVSDLMMTSSHHQNSAVKSRISAMVLQARLKTAKCDTHKYNAFLRHLDPKQTTVTEKFFDRCRQQEPNPFSSPVTLDEETFDPQDIHREAFRAMDLHVLPQECLNTIDYWDSHFVIGDTNVFPPLPTALPPLFRLETILRPSRDQRALQHKMAKALAMLPQIYFLLLHLRRFINLTYAIERCYWKNLWGLFHGWYDGGTIFKPLRYPTFSFQCWTSHMFKDWIETTWNERPPSNRSTTPSLYAMELHLRAEADEQYQEIMYSFVQMRDYQRQNPVMTVRGRQKIGKGAILKILWPDEFQSSGSHNTKDAMVHHVLREGCNLRVIDLPARDDVSEVVTSMVDAVVGMSALVFHVMDMDCVTSQSYDEQMICRSIVGNDYILINRCDESFKRMQNTVRQQTTKRHDSNDDSESDSSDDESPAMYEFQRKCANVRVFISSKGFSDLDRIFFVAASPDSCVPSVSRFDLFVPDPSEPQSSKPNQKKWLIPLHRDDTWPDKYKPDECEVFFRRGLAILLKRLHDLTFQSRCKPLVLDDRNARVYYGDYKKKAQFGALNLVIQGEPVTGQSELPTELEWVAGGARGRACAGGGVRPGGTPAVDGGQPRASAVTQGTPGFVGQRSDGATRPVGPQSSPGNLSKDTLQHELCSQAASGGSALPQPMLALQSMTEKQTVAVVPPVDYHDPSIQDLKQGAITGAITALFTSLRAKIPFT
jgi:hypothetical protein